MRSQGLDKGVPTNELQSAVEEWLAHLRVERGLSANTLAAYRRDLSQWVEFVAALGVPVWGRVTTTMVQDFLADLVAAGLARSTVARMVVAVRRFHAFLVAESLVDQDVAADVSPPTPAQRLPKALSIDEVTRLMEATGPMSPGGRSDRSTGDSHADPDGDAGAGDPKLQAVARRDRALVELLYGTGGRVSEVTGLDVDDLDLDGRSVRLVGKGAKERRVPLGSAAATAVGDWLTAGRPVLTRTARPNPALFINRRGARLGRQSAWEAVAEAGRRAGLAQPLSPHALRHSYATHLMAGGADIRVVQELLGHASVTTTQIYTRVTPDHLREVFLTAHPRAQPHQ